MGRAAGCRQSGLAPLEWWVSAWRLKAVSRFWYIPAAALPAGRRAWGKRRRVWWRSWGAGCSPAGIMKNNIYLLGPMAAGKTTVGKLLSRELGWGFVDLDSLVEKGTGHSVTEIFRAEGEGRFRSLEKQALLEAASRSELVVALGSGTFVDPDNRAIAMASGPCVFLDAPVEKILERAREHESRPLSAGIEDLKRICESRRASYALADVHVDAAASPERVVEAILQSIKKALA